MVDGMSKRPRPRPPAVDPITPEIDAVLTSLGFDDAMRAELREELPSIPRTGWRELEAWPYPPGLAGPLSTADGQPLHGAYERTRSGGTDLLVAVSGWPVERTRCPGPPFPWSGPTSPLHPGLVFGRFTLSLPGPQPGAALRAMDGGEAALVRVAAQAMPIAFLRTHDDDVLDTWMRCATSMGLAARFEQRRCGCGERAAYVDVARREPFDDLFDLDRMARWYQAALARTHVELAHRAADDIRSLRRTSPADFLGRAEEVLGSCGEVCWLDVDPKPWVKGLVVGDHPPCTLAGVHRCLDGGGAPSDTYPAWTAVRDSISDLVPPVDLVEYASALRDAG
jgi:hypothetical protein